MDGPRLGRRVRIYLSERAPFMAILDLLRREGATGATVFRGIAGFGVHGQVHAATLVDLAGSLPILLEWVDTPERVERLLPAVAARVEGLITVEDVPVVKFPRAALREIATHARVRDVMTPAERVDAATPETGLRDLVELLLRKRRNAIPVVDGRRRVVGIITNGDLVTRAGLPLRLELLRALGETDAAGVAAHLAALEGEGRTAGSIMTRAVVTIGPDVPLAEAARLMLLKRLKRLPVVDAEGRLLGMLSRFDILKTATTGFAAAPTAAPARPAAGQPPRRIGEVMNRDVPMVRPDTPLPEVLDAVMATRLHRAVVVDDDGRPAGGIVDTDLMQRVTPAAHPSLFATLMRRVRPTSPEEERAWQGRTAQRAADVMRPLDRLVVVGADTDIATAIDQALAKQVKVIVVTDENGRVVGMADRADLLGALASVL